MGFIQTMRQKLRSCVTLGFRSRSGASLLELCSPLPSTTPSDLGKVKISQGLSALFPKMGIIITYLRAVVRVK